MKIEYWKITLFILGLIIAGLFVFPRGRKLAEMYISSFRWHEASQIIEQELQKKPDDPRLLKDSALYAESQGDTEKELQTYEKLIKLRPNNIDYRFRLAELYRWNNRVKDELEQLETIAKLKPNDIQTHERLIDFYEWHKALDRTILHYLKLMELKPNELSYYYGLADVYVNVGQDEKAIAIYEKMVQKRPNDPDLRFVLGDVYEWKNDLDKALDQYFTYLNLRFPALAADHLFKEEVHVKEIFNEKDIETLDHLASIKLTQKKVKEVSSFFQNLIRSFPKDISWREKQAQFYVESDQPMEALAAYQALAKKFPKEKAYLYKLAEIYVWKDKTEDAFNIYQDLRDKDPESVEAQKGFAETALWTNRTREAISAYEYLIQKYPNNKQYKKQLELLYSWAVDYKKQPALEMTAHYRHIETINKKSRKGEFSHEYEGMASKYLSNRFSAKSRFQWLNMKDSSISPQMMEDISTVGVGLKYDLFSNMSIDIEPQLYMGGLMMTSGYLGGIKWDILDGLYTDIEGRVHELWTQPLDAVRTKGLKSGLDIYVDYKPRFFNEYVNLISSAGWNDYSIMGRSGSGNAKMATLKPLLTLWKYPKIEVGYFLDYQKAKQDATLTVGSPLIRRIVSHYIWGQMDYSTKTFRIFMNGGIGDDSKRKLSMSDVSLFQYLFKGELKLWDRLQLDSTYAYSSESSQTSQGIQSVIIGNVTYLFY